MKTYITNKVLIALGTICFVLAGLDIAIGHHGSFGIDALPFFYCLFGFVIYVALIFAATALRRLIPRPEDYYGRNAIDAEPAQRPEADNV
nr:hypothetical protein DBT41_14740 [Aerococcus urinae]